MIALIVALPLVFAFLLSLVSIIWNSKWLSKTFLLIGVLSPWIIFLASLEGMPFSVILGNWSRISGIEITLNRYNFYFILGELLVFSLTSIYSLNYFEREDLNKIFLLFLLMHAGFLGTFLSRDLFNFFIYIELASVSVFALICVSRGKGAKEAAFRYVVFFFLASIFLLFSIGIIYLETGYLNLELIRKNLVMSREIKIGLGIAFTSLILKGGIFPLFFWLPDAHAKADTPISALLSGLMVKTSAYGMVLLILYFPITHLETPLMIVAFSSMIFGVLLAVLQQNVKKLLAYSTVSQMGYILLGISTLNAFGAIYHVLAHSLFKSGLFLSVGALIQAQKSKNLNKLTYRNSPTLIVAIVFLSLAIGGISPFIGAVSKKELVSALSGNWVYLFYAVGVGTLIPFTKLNYHLAKPQKAPKPKRLESIVSLAMAMLTLILGLYFLQNLSFTDPLLIGLAILIFFALHHLDIFDFKIPNPIEKRAKDIGEENNFYTIIFVVFMILILLQVYF
ncbi:cation:proton antiporter [candidate division MSBL1 archaeon SCGC-AAA259I09]|uniref:Cation:proton antiporter n=3 Tax=candidate division MSBL1 TaxID=215777 RepID=A0A133UPT6_9EURY|nr:cation:proton antiporter [candidate division MSBL1 archaeon SCGC-AAA259D14]KXA93382.1 cation:proton antiporter [candidate division MSBL1 archaeon SCGC-AAA259E22]KXA96137.1 cation:proton antiporter [candidate division MSBL1 archaeon SCGC-AAA259I09]